MLNSTRFSRSPQSPLPSDTTPPLPVSRFGEVLPEFRFLSGRRHAGNSSTRPFGPTDPKLESRWWMTYWVKQTEHGTWGVEVLLDYRRGWSSNQPSPLTQLGPFCTLVRDKKEFPSEDCGLVCVRWPHKGRVLRPHVYGGFTLSLRYIGRLWLIV